MAFAHSPKIVTDNLVFYVDASNPKSYVSGSTIWRDLSGNGINAGLSGSMDTVFSGTNAQKHFALDRSLGTYASAPGYSVLTNATTDEVTICVLAKIVTFGSYFGIVQFGASNVSMYVCSDGGFSIQSNGDNAGICPIGTQINDDQWHYLVTSYKEGVEYKVYLDGELKHTEPTTDTEPASLDPIEIGRRNSSNSEAIGGDLAVVKIYNRALSTSEVQQNYNALKGRFGL